MRFAFPPGQETMVRYGSFAIVTEVSEGCLSRSDLAKRVGLPMSGRVESPSTLGPVAFGK